MLKERSYEPEIMDDLLISGEVVDQTLRELNTINSLLGGNQISISAFKDLTKGRKEVNVADLGCGGGDIMVEMAKYTRRQGIQANYLGIDANPHIIEYAEDNTSDFQEIDYKSINIFSDAFAELNVDIIHCCLFVHHFTEEELISLFQNFKKQARVGVIINDLHRHPLAYGSIKLLTRLFSKSYMVKNDAAVSVARGFKRKELIRIFKHAGITDFELSWRWAFRWIMIF